MARLCTQGVYSKQGMSMPEQQAARSEESLRHEFTECTLYNRHHTNLRFVVFSIFFAVMGGVGFVAFSKGQFHANAAVMARIAGVLVIALFWIYIERLSEMVNYYSGLRAELERALGYAHRLPGKGIFPRMQTTWRAFFVLVTLLWLYGAFTVPLEH
jgi:hypothetical protein